MPLQIYNSLARKKEEFIPQKSAQVSLYSCGVTVYDDCHIGHARSLYIFNVIRTYLEYRGLKVRFVRNITDIDDKIINRANELRQDWKDLVNRYIGRYYEDLAAMGIAKADIEPRATENIEEMKKYIQKLIDKGFAYPTPSGVYFSVRRFKEYGKLSGQSVEQMLTGVRKDADESKEDPLDFALWKASKPGEPSWPSPWGDGRPGWHIECSVMSTRYLETDTLDIHAGGRDLIFPHHENEIAQSEALTGKPFARYWIHHGLLTINGQKMSKSLGNFITIKDALAKYHADDLKMFYLSAHYSSPIDFTGEKIAEAHKAVQRFEILFQKISSMKMPAKKKMIGEVDFIAQRKKEFIEAMDNDFNTPQALSALFELVTDTNKFIETGKSSEFYAETVDQAAATISELARKVFGLSLVTFGEGVTDEEAALLEQRLKAKSRKDYKQADEIRNQLKQMGIIVEDKKDGTQAWRRG